MKLVWKILLVLMVLVAVALGVILWAGKAEAPEEEVKYEEPPFVEDGQSDFGRVILRELGEESEEEAPAETVVSSVVPVATESEPNASVEPEPEAIITVTIEDTGFEPAEVTVAPNTKVVWVNNGQALHQPKGEGFGTESGLPTGGEYAYVFTDAGEYAYVDALMPSLTGKVTVE